ncbi:flagellar motor switch protein FliM [Chitinispirillales bacterium ANBcel5]|uniref:flagellar motor switch protein FliM n=1 Tax=Cellulosispirillum alkaliphilum TaxID=3039283 RepID=UPI002A585030|nr:flagellar motor switch protein FliM [Chitinispirillales bacterium ANBcel5]
MSDILSQEEVDALLNAVSNGDDPELGSVDSEENSVEDNSGSYESSTGSEKSLFLYDFRRPDRVSKDQMRTLQNLHEGFARQFSTSLTNFLRTFVEIELVSVDQLTYSEFVMSISNPSCIYVFKMEPLEGTAIVEINPSLVFFIIDRLFGGQGRPSEQNRELTLIERNVIHRIVERSLSDLRDIWEHIGSFNPKIEAYETNPQFIQIAPPGETVILISLEVRMQNASGLMSICFPYLLLESVINNLSGDNWMASQSSPTDETRTMLEEEMRDIDLTLSTLIGKTSLKIRDLLQLQHGDVLCLNKHQDSDLIVQVEGKTKMAGRSGVIGRKKAVKITKILEEEVPGCDE